MARPKGSKNKARTVKASVDYVAVIAEKAAKKEKIESEVATLTANLDDLKTQLKAKKAELKAATKELAKAENKKAAAEAKAAEEAKKGEAEDVLKKLLASGMTAEEILATVYKGNIIKNLIMDCQSYAKYRPNETTGGIFVSWRRKEELPTGA